MIEGRFQSNLKPAFFCVYQNIKNDYRNQANSTYPIIGIL